MYRVISSRLPDKRVGKLIYHNKVKQLVYLKISVKIYDLHKY